MPHPPFRSHALARRRPARDGAAAPPQDLQSRIVLAGGAPFAGAAFICCVLCLSESGAGAAIALGGAGLLALLGAISVRMLLRSVVEPVTRFTARAAELAATPSGLPAARLPLNESLELAHLAGAINGLLDTLERDAARSARLHAESSERMRVRAEELEAIEKNQATARGEIHEAVKLGHFVSRVANELNNPLAAVCGYTEMLDRWPEIPPEARHRIAIVRTQAERCRILIRDLLVYIRKVKLELEPVPLNDLLASTAEGQRTNLLDWGIEPDVTLDPDNPHVSGDRAMLEQVLVHLITNARDALNSRAGNRSLQMKTRVTGDEAQIVVMDNGPGLQGSLKDMLLPPADGLFGEDTGGLGLPFCQGIIQEHGGRLQAFNRPGGGASFVISLPIASITEPEDPPMPERTLEIEAPPAAGERIAAAALRVLVVDDEPEIAVLIEEALGDDGHSVTKALNGTRAITCLDTGEFDLIISDMRMPGMNGKELHEQVRLRWPELLDRLVFITGDQSSDETVKFLRGSGARYLGKPFRVSELRKVVGSFSRRGVGSRSS